MNTYTKLKSGDWGVKGQVPAPTEGGTVTVTKRDGTSKNEVIGKIVSTENGTWVAEIVRKSFASAGAGAPSGARINVPRMGGRRRGAYDCDHCGDRVVPGTRCWETGLTH